MSERTLHTVRLAAAIQIDTGRLEFSELEGGRAAGLIGGLSVLDLSDRLVLSQPLTSWHLHILKRARLVAPTTRGRQRIYRLNRDMLQEYRELFNWVIDL